MDPVPTNLSPIVGWTEVPLESLESVCSSITFVSHIFDFVKFVLQRMDDELTVLSKDANGSDLMYPLTEDDAGAIALYTCSDCTLARELNSDLRTRSKRLPRWFPYIRLLMNGLAKLTVRRGQQPSNESILVYRGLNSSVDRDYTPDMAVRW